MKKIFVALLLPVIVTACGVMEPPMSSVMNSCEGNKSFSGYVSCIKNNYKRYPDRRITKAFYAQLDAIKEDVQRGRISETRARADAHLAYEATIGKDNARRAAAADRASAIYNMNRPRSTTCNTIGGYTNCNTW